MIKRNPEPAIEPKKPADPIEMEEKAAIDIEVRFPDYLFQARLLDNDTYDYKEAGRLEIRRFDGKEVTNLDLRKAYAVTIIESTVRVAKKKYTPPDAA